MIKLTVCCMMYPLVASSGLAWRPGLLAGDSLGSDAIENKRNRVGSCNEWINK